MAGRRALSRLPFRVDSYNSVQVCDPRTWSRSACADEFRQDLATALTAWQAEERKGVWLRIFSSAAHLIPVAVEQGFAFHHAQPTDTPAPPATARTDGQPSPQTPPGSATGRGDSVMLTRWLPDSPSRLPAAASHHIGVAGFVYDEATARVLVIQEKSGPTAGRNVWKLPGGLADAGEDMHVAVEREVLEETGIAAQFQSLCSVQEVHTIESPSRAASSDLYIVCHLKPLDANQPIRPQASEIAACEWMEARAFLGLPYYRTGVFHRSFGVAHDVACGRRGGLTAERLELGFRPGSNTLMYPKL